MTRQRLISVMAGAVLAVVAAVPLAAQGGRSVVLVTRGGERASGQLVDFDSRGFTVRVDGRNRTWAAGDVAVLDFTGATTFPASEVSQAGGEHLLVLRSGEIVRGTLRDMGGNVPMRLTFAVGGEERVFTSNDVSRVFLGRPGSPAVTLPGTPSDNLAPGTGRIRVAGNGGWVNTGLTVQQGQRLLFTSTGEVRLSADPNDVATPAGSRNGRMAPNAPLPGVLAGALIGRIGNGAPFGIGNQTSVPAPNAGMLFLAVNDDQVSDNAGAFGVDVTTTATPRRR
jgi:hypothetical protein